MSNSNTRVCRITGLTSAKGQKLNGSAGRVFLFGGPSGDRLPVYIDGHPGGPVALKRKNIKILPDGAFDCGTGVGRGTFRDTTFKAVAIDNEFSRIVAERFVSGGAARSRGSLMVIEEFLKVRKKQRKKGPLLILPTDLNVARAVNRIAAGDRDLAMDGPLNQTLQSVALLVRKETETGSMVLIKFYPHRLEPDGFKESLGGERISGVLAGAFKIYPCAYEDYYDAMEVRYVDLTSSNERTIRHEIYLDFGVEEIESYVRHATALGETDRLSPPVLAQVDPQSFWAAVLHIEVFMGELEKSNLHDLLAEWVEVAQGVQKSRESWQEASADYRSLSASIKAGTGNDWGIQSDRDHKKVSHVCAMAAISMLWKCAGEATEAVGCGSVAGEGKELVHVAFDTLDYYKGSELGKMFAAFEKANNFERDFLRDGETLEKKHRDWFLVQALEEAGFGSDRLELRSDPLGHCGRCGSTNQDNLMDCSGCNGAAYCSRECQKAAWKGDGHREECSHVIAEGRRLIRDCIRRSGEAGDVIVTRYEPRSTLPTEHCVMSETSALGSVGVMWNPGMPSFLNFSEFKRTAGNEGPPELAPTEQDIFENLFDLSPPMRFLLTCGPLPDISIAQASLDDALGLVGGEITRLRVNGAGFNALEWAAKKGNAETVEWLCTDGRTKALVSAGSPVGWACYTGQVDIARSLVAHGAYPAATDDILWNKTPPLLVAAQNGQLEAMKYLVEELGQDIHMRDPLGRGVLESIETNPHYKQMKGHQSAYKWAKEKMN